MAKFEISFVLYKYVLGYYKVPNASSIFYSKLWFNSEW